ncbi:MAG: hypothetical protein IJW10_05175 [Clostridia bacterium]|nr:hypothetical protein [Clostridia bacterium]
MTIFIIIICIAVAFYIIKPYVMHYDTVLSYTGGLGSGKSLISTQMAVRLLRKNRWKVFFHNLRHPKHKIAKPVLYSSIPLRISKKEWVYKLTPEHLTLQAKLPEKCVIFIDEIDSYASQFDFKLPNIITNFDEFCRFYRHYTKGGYLVCNTQATDNLVLQIRRRMNTVYNLMHFKKWFFVFYTVKVRNISISEEIKTIETEDVEDNMSTLIGVLPIFCKRYDTYCYSGRYETVPEAENICYNRLKTNKVIKCPRDTVKPLTTSDDVQ